MFWHIYQYRLKNMLQSKVLVFWLLLFPIVLASLFKFAFSNILVGERFETIRVAIVDKDNYLEQDTNFEETMRQVENEKGEPLFAIEKLGEEEAKQKLQQEQIEGYVIPSENMQLYISKSDYGPSILKSFLEQYISTKDTLMDIVGQNPMALQEGLLEDLTSAEEYMQEVGKAKNFPNPNVIYFYTVIGMVCLYSAFIGVYEIATIQANCSTLACRNTISPVSKSKTVLAGLLACLTIQLGVMLLLFLYMILVLKINFGNEYFYMGLISSIGSLTGILFGALVGACIKKSEETKVGICVAITMALSFLSGMMASNVKYYVDTYIPWLNRFNPVCIVTDALYSLYYYDTYTRVYQNVIVLSGISIVLAIATFLVLRRQKYASI